MDTLTEKRAFPCEPATEEELYDVTQQASNGDFDSAEKLRKIIMDIPEDNIPWSSIHTLCILGKANDQCNEVFAKALLQPGVYINHTGNWLFLIRLEDAVFQACMDRCGTLLETLMLCNTELPSLDLASLTALDDLSVSKNRDLITINGLEKLSRLRQLALYNSPKITQLPSLENLSNLVWLSISDCTSLTQLPALDSLTNLKWLYLFDCTNLTQLPALDSLTNLTTLVLFDCTSLTQLPALDNLTNLTQLNLSGCSNLTLLPVLDSLTNLTELNLSWCKKIHELPNGIRSMKALKKLNLLYMHLHDLPDWLPEITENFSSDTPWDSKEGKPTVYLCGTAVDSIREMSIFSQPYEVVAEWFKNRALGRTRPLNEIKVVFLGDGEAGKSRTIARLMGDGGDPVDYMDETTPGIVIKHKPYTYDGRDFQVHYWDFGGQEIMHSMHRIFLTNRTMYVVLLNAREDKQGEQAQYWLQNIQSFAPDAPVLLVLNKIDRNPKAELAERTLRSKYPGVTQIVRLSATEFDKDRFNKEFTDILLDEIVKTGYLEAQWPASWIKVKERLEKMESHYILGNDYKAICAECQVDDVQTELLHWFNDLGVSFCFCDKEDYALKKHVILRPDWITNGLYIILFNECAGARNGQLPHESIYALLERAGEDKSISCTLPEARYDRPGDIEYVLGVMRKFQLSLDTKDGKEFIPMLCQQDSTVDIHYYENDTDILEFNMEFEYLPENLLHRLMVIRHTELDMASAWRKGARFEFRDLGYSAVVLIDVNSLRFFIRHTDPMHRPNTYLTMLKANVDRIVEKMGITPPICKLVYKLDGKRDEFDYDNLKLRLEVGQTHELSTAHKRMIPIQKILDQAAPDGLENERKLLEAIVRSCLNIQGEPDYCLKDGGYGLEDKRNRRVRDDLYGWGYNIQDQTQRGRSGTGSSIGELDLLLHNEKSEPWTAIEALRVSNGTKTEWKKHLKKLVGNYNYFGAPFLYLLTYVDAAPTDFARIWKGYQKTLTEYSPSEYRYCENSFTDLNDSNSPRYIKAAKCLYSCGGDPITVYHIFARIPLHGE